MWKRWVCVIVWTETEAFRNDVVRVPWHCHDTATSLRSKPRRSSKKWQVKCKWWSLDNVLIYLQKKLDILAQTYSLFWRQSRALYVMFFSDGKKPKRRQFKPYLERRFSTRPGRKWLTSWSTVNIIWSRACNLNRKARRSSVTMTTTVYQNNFRLERGCKTFQTFTRISVDGAWISNGLVAKAVEHLANTTENANFSLEFSGLAISAASSNLFGVCVVLSKLIILFILAKGNFLWIEGLETIFINVGDQYIHLFLIICVERNLKCKQHPGGTVDA